MLRVSYTESSQWVDFPGAALYICAHIRLLCVSRLLSEGESEGEQGNEGRVSM